MAENCKPSAAGAIKRTRSAVARLACASLLAALLAACNAEGSAYGEGASHDHGDHALRVVDGDADKGRVLVKAYECGVCHKIPGIRGADGIVGPPLEHFAQRQFIAGIVPNHPATLVRWVKDPPSLSPRTGMPNMGLTDDEARHIAAYLYTLR